MRRHARKMQLNKLSPYCGERGSSNLFKIVWKARNNIFCMEEITK
jgi:hypothetical protein